MRILGITPSKKNRVLVDLEGPEAPEAIEPLELALDVVESSGIYVGDDVSAKDLARLQEDDTKWRVRQAALHLLSYKPIAKQELRRRLRSKSFPNALVEWCLGRLEEQGLIDDRAFASAYVRSRIRLRPRGRRRLVQELRQKGVSAETAAQAIDDVFGNEETSERALACAAARRWLDRQSSTLIESLASEDRSDEGEARTSSAWGWRKPRPARGKRWRPTPLVGSGWFTDPLPSIIPEVPLEASAPVSRRLTVARR